MFAVEVAFVAREYDECVVQLLLAFERFENVGDTIFHRSEHPQSIPNSLIVRDCLRTEWREIGNLAEKGWFAFGRFSVVRPMRKLGVSVKVLVALCRDELAPARIGHAAVCILNQVRMDGFV